MLDLPDGITTCLFDLDGVLTQTAKVHAAAWKEMFDGFLEQRAEAQGEEFREFALPSDYDEYVDGKVAEQEGLKGKPAPDTFLAAAQELGVPPARAVVFEDALAGVEAGRAGHFGCVVGVDRTGQAAELAEHGADIVVNDVEELLDR
jgi:beta-phosphoglucomutase-like phosphatase (HAD superfamily)